MNRARHCLTFSYVLCLTLLPSLILWRPTTAAAQTDAANQILEAARSGEMARMEALLQARPDLVNVRDGEGMTPLHHAVLGGYSELAELLLDRGADITAVNAWNYTPLHHAAYEGDAVLVALLLARGADVMAREARGRTPLYLAVNWGRSVEVVEQLIAAGADVNDRTPSGEEILLSTLYYGRPEVIDALIAAGARLPDDDHSLVRAAYLAAANGFESVFRMAIQEAEAREIPWWDYVPMHTAARGGLIPVGEALLAHGVAADEKNMYGLTPLHIAAENGRLAFAEYLLRNGASLDESSVMGMTALQFARESGHDSVASRLLEMGASSAPPVFPELRGEWLGQPEPGDSPERFALGIVSGHGFDSEHSPAAFSPDGKEVYWTQAFRGPVLFSRLEDGRWTKPRPAPFVSEYGEGEPIFSPDGERLYFLSMRPLQPGAEPGDENIWYVVRERDGWSQPRPLDSVVNDFDHHWLFSISESGALYFSSVREGGYGSRDIYRSRRVNGVHQPPENLGPVINTDGNEHTPFIAPDESYLILATTAHGPTEGMFHFVISYREADGGWSAPQALDATTAPVNDPLCPLITADGKFMFFIGSGDIWWTRAEFIQTMRPH